MLDREFRGSFGGDDPPPNDSSNTVITEDSLEAIIAISEAPILGLVDGTKSFYLGDTPLQAPDGSINFKNFQLGIFPGYGETITSQQGGFGSATNVNTEMLTSQPITRTINTLGIDFIDIRILISRLYTDNDEGATFGYTASVVVEWKPDNEDGWYLMDAGGSNPQVNAEGYTVYGNSFVDRGPPSFWQGTTPTATDLTTGVWFNSGSNNTPLIATASGSWISAPSATYILQTVDSLPFWTWLQYDEIGTLLRSRAWVGPSTTDPALLWAPDYGGDPRAGDYWLCTDTNELRYFNGTNWLTANSGVADTVYPIGEFAGTGVVSISQRIISSPVVWQFRFPVPRLDVPIQVRITKTTASSHDDIPHIFSDLNWESAIAHIARQFKYQNLAIAQINAQATGSFTSIPDFSGVYYGRIIKVPSNYNSTTRVYSGVWDGLWILAWTDNPAFIVKDLVENTTYGIGSYYQVTLNDWDVYDAGQWCDHICPDGAPRFTFNGIISEPRVGKEAIDYICGIFGARFIDDGNGFARILIDRSDVPAVQLFTKENAENGVFTYTFSDPSTRYNDLTISFTNPDINWQADRRRLYWQPAIDHFGRVPYGFVAVGCIYVNEAYRRGRYTISTSQTEKMMVQFKTSRNGLNLQPYDIVLLADELIYGRPPDIDSLPGYFLQTSGTTTPLLAADTNQPLFFTDYALPDQGEVFDNFKTGRTVLNQNGVLADISGGVTLTQSVLTTTDARTVLLRDPIYIESGLTYFVTFQTLEGPVEYQVDPTWTGTKYDIKVTTDITQTLPENAVFSLRISELNELPKPFRVLTITPADTDDVVEITAVEVNRTKWAYVDQDQFLVPTSFIFAVDVSGSMVGTRLATLKAVMNTILDRIDELRLLSNSRVDISIVAWEEGYTQISRLNVSSSDIADIKAFVNGLVAVGGTFFSTAATQIKNWFDATRTDTGLERRVGIFITDGEPSGGVFGDIPAAASAAIIADILDPSTGLYSLANGNTVSMYGINIELVDTSNTAHMDNTSGDGIPVVSGTDATPLTNVLRSLLTSPVRVYNE